MTLVTAESGEGAGSYSFDLNFSINTPAFNVYNTGDAATANTRIAGGTYQGSITFDIV